MQRPVTTAKIEWDRVLIIYYEYEFYFTAVKNSLGILSITQPFFLIG